MNSSRALGDVCLRGAVLILVFAAAAAGQDAGPSPGFWTRVADTMPHGAAPASAEEKGFWGRTREGVSAIWSTGHPDVFVPGYIWHVPWEFSPSQRERYNELAWGLGFGRTAVDRHSRLRTLYVMGSADSFNMPQYMAGYAWRAQSGSARAGLHLGGGYTLMVIGRDDPLHYAPIPLLLPLASVGTDRFEVMGAYVPGFGVAFFLGKLHLGPAHY